MGKGNRISSLTITSGEYKNMKCAWLRVLKNPYIYCMYYTVYVHVHVYTVYIYIYIYILIL